MQEVYLYQTLHLLDGRCHLLNEHVDLLHRWSTELFARPFLPDKQLLARQIAQMAAKSAPAGCDRSQFVRLIVPASGEQEYTLQFGGMSLYRGYDLRSLTPDAITLQYDPLHPDAPTSAREAAEAFARQQARLRGASVAVRCDRDGIVRTADEAPLLAIHRKTVILAEGGGSVERHLALRAVEAAGLELEIRPVERDELPGFDELFYVDHRGVTALAHCDGHPYMAIFAQRIAKALREAFSKN